MKKPDGEIKIILIVSSVLIVYCLMSCGRHDAEPTYPFVFDQQTVLDATQSILQNSEHLMYADQYVANSVKGDTSALWLSSDGLRPEAEILMSYLHRVGDEGINPEIFHVKLLQERIDSLRSWEQSEKVELLTDSMASEVEALLTQALVRYSYGQRYGYVLPHKIFNHLLVDVDAVDKSKTIYRRLFDIDTDRPSDSLAYVSVNCVRGGSLDQFLESIQPNSRLHGLLSQEYKNAISKGDTARARLAALNLERSRWRYERPDTGAYVFVNLASQMLSAVDTHRDTCIEMRICCGNSNHKTPMLTSKISYIEFNPYWVVPMTIVRNEIAVNHTGDSAYFARNNMEAINNSTGESSNPRYLSADQLRSGKYTIRQDKGAGNSLGRLIFRFPNNFSVFLHDTNQPGAFNRENRAVSHGCVRLQRPMDLVTFLLGPEADPYYIDRIRISIDLPPLTDAGRKLKAKDPEPMKRHSFSSTIPVFIEYWTLYPDKNGKLTKLEDAYGYDKALASSLSSLITIHK